MKDDGLIVAAWAEARERGIPAVLATVVKVAGSAYRSPGARMLITENGMRTGSVSGGCLEGDLMKKAWWLTANGPTVQIYDSSSDDESTWAFGLGCNGVVQVLLERWEASSEQPVADLLLACRDDRRGGAMATVISEPGAGSRVLLFPKGEVRSSGRAASDASRAALLERTAREAFATRSNGVLESGGIEIFFEYVAPPVPLLIVGAGQDVLPVLRFAKELGWNVTITDSRANQARPDRFPRADRVVLADLDNPLSGLIVDDRTVAVVMSHSYPQDRTFVQALSAVPIRYLGVLGPRKRTDRMLEENRIERVNHLHSPVGLDIGGETPEEIALAIIAEIQAALTRRPGGMLSQKPGPIHEERRTGAAVKV